MITVGTYIFKQEVEKYLSYVINGEELLIVDGKGNEIRMFKSGDKK